MSHRVLGVIPARGGSKGLPGKNLRPLAGRPLIAHSVEAARRAHSITRVVVSTEDPASAEAARAAGADGPWGRPSELATDTASAFDVMRHAVEMCEAEERTPYEFVVYLQPTSPLRSPEDIEASVELLIASGAPAVFTVCELEKPLAWTVQVGEGGALSPHPVAGVVDYRIGRQGYRPAYRLNGAVYAYRREAVRAGQAGIVPGTLAHVMPVERSVDIDTAYDLALAEALFSARPARDHTT